MASNPSPSIVFILVAGFTIYKAQALLTGFLTIKDLNKKRLIQKFEETYVFHEKNFLNSELKLNYERLCEESQLKALIGCQYCSKEMANYILSRETITEAIRIYHRIKDDIKIEESVITPQKIMSDKRIKLNYYAGVGFYFSLSSLGLLPFLIMVSMNFFNLKASINSDVFMNAWVNAIFLFIVGFVLLYQGFKPTLVKRFCELKSNNSRKNHEDSSVEEVKVA
ncbi:MULTISPECIES: hypothetical protein [unclassified Acinetobacter]|uniref:hypothetical protein n=1 Tax=unclassified Acinetobacter TaxID=196816 RepID=UPI001C221CEF|nr:MULTISPECIES: hypothetical protein [unclassified Acinetobacter]